MKKDSKHPCHLSMRTKPHMQHLDPEIFTSKEPSTQQFKYSPIICLFKVHFSSEQPNPPHLPLVVKEVALQVSQQHYKEKKQNREKTQISIFKKTQGFINVIKINIINLSGTLLHPSNCITNTFKDFVIPQILYENKDYRSPHREHRVS